LQHGEVFLRDGRFGPRQRAAFFQHRLK
jgi:hypothetical protein